MYHRYYAAFSRSISALRIVMLLGISISAAFMPFLFTYSTASAAPVQDRHIQQAQHALPVSSKPAADAVLQSPPPSVQIWFSEPLVPATSKALVVDTTNRQVDMKDSHVNANNDEEMDLSLPLLSSGTYVVVWQTQSATDGHIARGSFIFRIARPDGSIPPIPRVLPTGHIPGSGVGAQSSNSLDGPTLLQTIATWIALLLFTFWVGGIIWETGVFPPQKNSGSDPITAIQQASQRRIRYIPYVLAGILIANIGIIAGQAAELAGDWSGIISWPLLHGILFESHFGTFWWLREITTLVALLFIVGQVYIQQYRRASTKPLSGEKSAPTSGVVTSAYPIEAALLRGDLAFMHVLADIPHLPRQLMEGLRQRSWYEHIEGILALLLLYAFALSGHAAAVTSSPAWEALGVDMLHLLTDAAWVGGLLYIGVVLLPTLNKRSSYEWADILAVGLPRFSVVAIVSVTVLATTGSFNTTEHLTAYQQLWTTTYGRTLTVKILVFLCMVGISAYHAFFLRPRLAYALVETRALWEDDVPVESGQAQGTVPTAPARAETISVGAGQAQDTASPVREGPVTATSSSHAKNESGSANEERISPGALVLGKRLERWLRLEGMLGAVVLLCVALLAAFAGSLTTSTSATAASQPTGPVVQTQTVGGETITLKVTPATFGTNTFVVIVKNAQGQPETGAGVEITTNMLDMDMGTETTQLQADPKQPGVYSQQADLTMGGHWEVDVRVLPANSDNFIKATFDFSAST